VRQDLGRPNGERIWRDLYPKEVRAAGPRPGAVVRRPLGWAGAPTGRNTVVKEGWKRSGGLDPRPRHPWLGRARRRSIWVGLARGPERAECAEQVVEVDTLEVVYQGGGGDLPWCRRWRPRRCNLTLCYTARRSCFILLCLRNSNHRRASRRGCSSGIQGLQRAADLANDGGDGGVLEFRGSETGWRTESKGQRRWG
jgi:hypothetical protein